MNQSYQISNEKVYSRFINVLKKTNYELNLTQIDEIQSNFSFNGNQIISR